MTLLLAVLLFFVNTSSGSDEILGCDPKCHGDPRIGCTLDYEGIDCPRSELYNVDNGLWPGKPEFIKITKSSLATQKSDPQAFNVTWAPPNDGSVKLLKGFEVQFHPTSSSLLGSKGCYVFNVTHSSSTVHLLATSNFTISCRLTSSFGPITLYTQIYTLPRPPSKARDKYTYDVTEFRARRHSPPKKTNLCDKDPRINPNFDEISRLLTVTLDDALPDSTYEVRLMRGQYSDSKQVIHVPAVKSEEPRTVFGNASVLVVGRCFKIWVNLVQCDNRWSTGDEPKWCIPAFPAKPVVITPAPVETKAPAPGGLSSSMIAVFILIVIMVIILGATFSLYIYRDRLPNSVGMALKKLQLCRNCRRKGGNCQLHPPCPLNNQPKYDVIEENDDAATELCEINKDDGATKPAVIPAPICVFYACPHPDMVEMKKCIQAFLKLLCSIVGDQSQVYDYLDHDQANKHANPEAWFEYIINGGKQRQFLVLYTDVLTRLLKADKKNLYFPALQDYREGREFSPFLRKFGQVPSRITHCVTFGFHDNEDQPALEINPLGIFHQLTSIDNGRHVFNWKEFETLMGALKVNPPTEQCRPDTTEFMESVDQMAKVMEEDPDWFPNFSGKPKTDILPPSTSGSQNSISDVDPRKNLTPERTSGYGTATASQESTPNTAGVYHPPGPSPVQGKGSHGPPSHQDQGNHGPPSHHGQGNHGPPSHQGQGNHGSPSHQGQGNHGSPSHHDHGPPSHQGQGNHGPPSQHGQSNHEPPSHQGKGSLGPPSHQGQGKHGPPSHHGQGNHGPPSHQGQDNHGSPSHQGQGNHGSTSHQGQGNHEPPSVQGLRGLQKPPPHQSHRNLHRPPSHQGPSGHRPPSHEGSSSHGPPSRQSQGSHGPPFQRPPFHHGQSNQHWPTCPLGQDNLCVAMSPPGFGNPHELPSHPRLDTPHGPLSHPDVSNSLGPLSHPGLANHCGPPSHLGLANHCGPPSHLGLANHCGPPSHLGLGHPQEDGQSSNGYQSGFLIAHDGNHSDEDNSSYT